MGLSSEWSLLATVLADGSQNLFHIKNLTLLTRCDQMDPICNGSFLMVSNKNALEAYMLMGVPKVMMIMLRRLTC